VAPDAPRPHIDPVVQALIRRKARRMIGRAGLTASDQPDLEQELVLHLLRRLPAAAGQPQCRALVNTVLDRCLANILRDLLAQKRNPKRVGSLHQRVPTEEGQAELGQTISREEQDARTGRQPRSDEERVDLQQDLAAALARLPPDLRELAERLQHQGVAEAARSTGVPRTTLYAGLRRLRQHFEQAGLRAYL
jgi:RNA polymerase sigma-70 factor, ECF subfamily